jgi:hypothetical protein
MKGSKDQKQYEDFQEEAMLENNSITKSDHDRMSQDFQMFLNSQNDELFDHQIVVNKNQENIRILREKTLRKIEKKLKKLEKNRAASNARRTSFGNRGDVDVPFCSKLSKMCQNKVFLCLMGCLTGLFYVVTGI